MINIADNSYEAKKIKYVYNPENRNYFVERYKKAIQITKYKPDGVPIKILSKATNFEEKKKKLRGNKCKRLANTS